MTSYKEGKKLTADEVKKQAHKRPLPWCMAMGWRTLAKANCLCTSWICCMICWCCISSVCRLWLLMEGDAVLPLPEESFISWAWCIRFSCSCSLRECNNCSCSFWCCTWGHRIKSFMDIELSHSFNTHPSTSITECTSVLWSYFTFLLGISLRRLGVSSGLAKSHLFCPDICVCFIFPLLPWGMHTFYYLTFIFPRGWLCIWLFCFLFPHVPKGVYEYHYLISTLLLYSEMHKYWLILFHLSSITVVWNDVSLWKSSLYWVCM